MTVDRVDAWAFEQARIMVEAVGARRGETIEAMLAEGLGVLALAAVSPAAASAEAQHG